jgi:glycosyltransferase involved in cell wall biosynthesis
VLTHASLGRTDVADAIVDGPTVTTLLSAPLRMPAISVIVPTYNCARWLHESLDSIFAQTERDCEVIVVDDGSTDETPRVLGTYTGRIMLVEGAHGGLAAARNLGLARATGEWIAFHDADDVAVPDRLAWSRAFLREHPTFDAVFGNGRRMAIDEAAKADVVPARYVGATAGRSLTVVDLFEGYPVYFQGALVPRRTFDAAGPFDPAYRVQPDLEYGYRLFPHLRAACVGRTMFHYRWHTTNNSGDRLGTRYDIARVLERLPVVAPGAVRAIGARRIRDQIARHYFQIGLARLADHERTAARQAFVRAAALRPLHPRYQWMRIRTAAT